MPVMNTVSVLRADKSVMLVQPKLTPQTALPNSFLPKPERQPIGMDAEFEPDFNAK